MVSKLLFKVKQSLGQISIYIVNDDDPFLHFPPRQRCEILYILRNTNYRGGGLISLSWFFLPFPPPLDGQNKSLQDKMGKWEK